MSFFETEESIFLWTYGNPASKMYDDGVWKYTLKQDDDGEGYAIILGLVDEDMEAEELIVPEKLGGYEVTQIGYSWTAIITAPTTYYTIVADNVKNIILENPIIIDNASYKSAFYEYNGNILYNFDTIIQFFHGYYIRFNCTGGEQTTYIIRVKSDNKITMPIVPTKKGYKFDGWYLDKEHTVKWDFQNDIFYNDLYLEYTDSLMWYGKLIFYAKWIEE